MIANVIGGRWVPEKIPLFNNAEKVTWCEGGRGTHFLHRDLGTILERGVRPRRENAAPCEKLNTTRGLALVSPGEAWGENLLADVEKRWARDGHAAPGRLFFGKGRRTRHTKRRNAAF